MANYKVVDTEKLDADLTVVADAIREKGGTSEPLAFPSGMADAVRGIESRGVNWLEYIADLNNAFKKIIFPENTGLDFYLPNLIVITSAFDSAKNVKKIKLKNDIQREVNFGMAFQYSDLELLDLSEFNCLITNFGGAFRACGVLREIIGTLYTSKTCSVSNAFISCHGLESVRFKENSIYATIAFQHSKILSDESIQSIIDGLASVDTMQTLTFHSDVITKLTDEQLETITNKNWRLG